MRGILFILAIILLVAFGSIGALADRATVDLSSEDVEASDDQIAISVALPAGVVGKRVDRAVLEVTIVLGESIDAQFNAFPLLELYEEGSELPKQTLLVASDFSGVARFDVTRFVRAWTTTDTKHFVLGSVSESNGTAVGLASSPGAWASSQKARLVVEYNDRDGTSLATQQAE